MTPLDFLFLALAFFMGIAVGSYATFYCLLSFVMKIDDAIAEGGRPYDG